MADGRQTPNSTVSPISRTLKRFSPCHTLSMPATRTHFIARKLELLCKSAACLPSARGNCDKISSADLSSLPMSRFLGIVLLRYKRMIRPAASEKKRNISVNVIMCIDKIPQQTKKGFITCAGEIICTNQNSTASRKAVILQ